jgi:hypothetical protein
MKSADGRRFTQIGFQEILYLIKINLVESRDLQEFDILKAAKCEASSKSFFNLTSAISGGSTQDRSLYF